MTIRRARLALAITALSCLAAFAPGCVAATDDTAAGEDDYTKRGKLQLVVTVDWEGRDLRDDNLAAMEDLRARFPQVKIVHFLNAAYFTKPGATASDVKVRINRALRAGDEKGLHIHGWKRLFEASGVTFRGTPSFWGTSIDPHGYECASDCGHEVPISLYTADELRKVVKFSLDTLESNGFGRAKSFRCGGWIAKQPVRDAIAAEGLRWEHSEVPTQFLEPELGKLPIYAWLHEVWPTTTPTSQPHKLQAAAADLVEVPDNGALADYMSTQQMIDVFEANKTEYLRDRKKTVVVSIGFHEETAATYLPALEAALTRIYDEARVEKLPMDNVTSSAVAPR